MPTPLELTRLFRCELDVSKSATTPFQLKSTGQQPSCWPGNPIRFEFLLKKDKATIFPSSEVEDMETMTVYVTDSEFLGTQYTSGVADSTQRTTDVSAEVWERTGADRGQHFWIELTAAETELAIPDGSASKKYGLVVVVDGVTVGRSFLEVVRDGIPESVQPVQAGNIIPAGAEYDGAGEYTIPTELITADRLYRISFGANDDSLDNDGEIITTTSTNFIAATTTLVLNGDANELVTAVLRTNVYLASDETIALIGTFGGAAGILGSGTENLVADSMEHTVTTMGASATPQIISPFVIIPDGGEFIQCALIKSSATSSGFKVRFNAPIPNPATNYQIGWTYKP